MDTDQNTAIRIPRKYFRAALAMMQKHIDDMRPALRFLRLHPERGLEFSNGCFLLRITVGGDEGISNPTKQTLYFTLDQVKDLAGLALLKDTSDRHVSIEYVADRAAGVKLYEATTANAKKPIYLRMDFDAFREICFPQTDAVDRSDTKRISRRTVVSLQARYLAALAKASAELYEGTNEPVVHIYGSADDADVKHTYAPYLAVFPHCLEATVTIMPFRR